jgi:hypothetical protein
MKIEDVNLKFQGFDPSELMSTYLETILRAVHEESPYGSTVKATFTRTNDAIVGVLNITSVATSFVAKTTGNGLKRVGEELVQQIRGQIDKWKQVRFQLEA